MDEGAVRDTSARTRVLQVALAVLPIVTAAARAVRRHWFPIGDSAQLYIRAADVLTEHHPLLAAWTSASLSVGRNMNNPGAMYDWLIAPFAHAFSPGVGAAVGVASVNIAVVIGVSIAANAVGGRSFERWMVLAAAALSWSMGSELLFDMWQAHALMLPFLLFLVLLTGYTNGHTRSLPWLFVVGSLLLQTHISYAYIAAILAVGCTGYRWLVHRGRTCRERLDLVDRRNFAWTVGVTAVLWAPSVWEQFFGVGEGNLGRLARSVGGGDFTLGVGNATKAVSSVLALPVWWLRSGFSNTLVLTLRTDTADGFALDIPGLPSMLVASASLALLVGLLVSLAVAAHRRKLELQRTACAVAVMVTIGSVASLTALTIGPSGFTPHHVRWLWVAAVFVHVVALWTLVSLAVLRRPGIAMAEGWAVVAVTGALAIVNVSFLAHPEGPVKDRAANAVLADVFPHLGVLASVAPVRYDVSNLRVYEPFSSAIMMELQHLGIEFRVSNEIMIRHLGESRRARGDEPVVFQLEGAAALDYDGPACRIAQSSQVRGAQGVAAAATRQTAIDALTSGEVVVVDGSSLDAGASAQLGAALDGDVSAARGLVDTGQLGVWVRDGTVEVPGTDVSSFADALDLVGLWAGTTYALFGTLPLPCPA
jgi:hypothetical protein